MRRRQKREKRRKLEEEGRKEGRKKTTSVNIIYIAFKLLSPALYINNCPYISWH